MTTDYSSADGVQLPEIRTELPGPKSRAVDGLRFEASGLAAWARGRIQVVFERGDGPFLTDVDGNRFLDLTSSFGVASLGYAPPAVARAIDKQASRLQHIMAGIFPHDLYPQLLAALAERFGRSASPEVCVVGSGAEAVEVALKIGLRSSGRAGILSFTGAFHGQTLGSLPVNGIAEFRVPFLPLLGGNVTWAPYPNQYRPPARTSDVLDFSLSCVEQALRGMNSVPVGAVVVEPVQNPSGYIVPPRGFLAGLAQLCRANGCVLVVDEIFTGAGRCGEWLVCDSEDVKPDIVCVGKSATGGMPLAATIADHRHMATIVTESLVPLHGSTYMGNPVSCASALACLHEIATQGLIERSRNLGKSALTYLRERLNGHSGIGDIRGLGLAIAIEFVTDAERKTPAPNTAMRVASGLFGKGVIVLISGLPHLNVITIAPAINIGEQQLEWGLQEIVDTIRAIAGEA